MILRTLTSDGVAAAAGLAADEALLLRHGRGQAPPADATLRLYTYRDCALVGRYQSLADEIDVDACRALGVEVGRRPTGGGAIVMTPAQLGVAVAARAVAEESPRQALARWARGVIAGLEELGVAARFRDKNDLEVGGRKIAGLGLYLDGAGAVLFHASVLVDLDVARMLRVLRIPGAKLSDKAVARVDERVTTVSRELGRRLLAADVREAFAAGFARGLGARLEPGSLDAGEARRAGELERERHGAASWIEADSPRRDARGSAVLKTPEGLVRVFAGVHGDTVKSVLFAGDYNALPPELPRLEAALRWCRADEASIAAVAGRALGEGALGVPATRIAAAVWEAAGRALELARASHPLRDGSCFFPEEGA
jgi:lipoate-protein ligase A